MKQLYKHAINYWMLHSKSNNFYTLRYRKIMKKKIFLEY